MSRIYWVVGLLLALPVSAHHGSISVSHSDAGGMHTRTVTRTRPIAPDVTRTVVVSRPLPLAYPYTPIYNVSYYPTYPSSYVYPAYSNPYSSYYPTLYQSYSPPKVSASYQGPRGGSWSYNRKPGYGGRFSLTTPAGKNFSIRWRR